MTLFDPFHVKRAAVPIYSITIAVLKNQKLSGGHYHYYLRKNLVSNWRWIEDSFCRRVFDFDFLTTNNNLSVMLIPIRNLISLGKIWVNCNNFRSSFPNKFSLITWNIWIYRLSIDIFQSIIHLEKKSYLTKNDDTFLLQWTPTIRTIVAGVGFNCNV